MPWDENNYPASMKNLRTLVRRKAIDIANAMLAEGHQEEDAIPIAISQAKKWAEDASTKEKTELKQKDIADHPFEGVSRGARLMKRDVQVIKGEKGYAVQTVGAKRPGSWHKSKQEAVKRAQEIAEKRGTKVLQ